MKTLIAMPMYENVKPETVRGLLGNIIKDVAFAQEARSLVADARNTLALKAIEGGYDNILWIDADMDIPKGAVEAIIKDAEDHEVVTGICFKRTIPTAPTIVKELYWDRNGSGIITHGTTPYLDYPKDDIFEIAGCGMAFTIMHTDLLERIVKQFGESPFNQLPQMGEDYSFCWRLQQMGVKIWCDSRIKIGHVGSYVYTEEDWFNQEGLGQKSDEYQKGFDAGVKAGMKEALERLAEWIGQKSS